MKLNLLDKIYSPQDLKAIIVEVRRYARWYAQAVIKNKVSGASKLEPLAISETAAAIIAEIAGGKPLDQKSLDELIEYLETLAAETPCMVITLAAIPGNSLKRTLVTWCRQNIDPQLLVDFRFNATILGGMVVNYGSHVYDWSFRRQILANRARFPEVLRRV